MSAKSAMKVFISHSTADRWAARKLSEDLDRLGIVVFLDEKDIQTGASIDQSIQSHLASSDHFLILLSPASVKSDWVLIELGGAIALKKHLVPVLFYLGANDIPRPIANYLARDINDIHRYYEELLRKPSPRGMEPSLAGSAPASKGGRRRRAAFKVGDKIQLPEIRPALATVEEQQVGWTDEMDAYLGKTAHITAMFNGETSGLPVVELDIDEGIYVWLPRWLLPAD